jgi:hypothetical protein
LLPPEGTSGTLVIHGNVPNVKVYVDEVYKGTFAEGSSIQLEGGTHTVRYSAKGYVDSAKKDIRIELNKEASDTYNLAVLPPPPPNLGNLTLRTNPGAHISVDGLSKGDADGNGSLTVKGLKPGKHFVDVKLDGFVAAQRRDLEVAAGKNANVEVMLAPVAASIDYFRASPISIDDGQSVTLSWKVDNASGAVMLEPVGTVKAADSMVVTPDRTTTYRLLAGGGTVPQSLTVTVRPKAPVQPTTDNSADLAGIRAAILRFNTAFQSRNMGTLRKEWPDLGKPRQKELEPLFKSHGVVLIKETCAGQPTINRVNAEWQCVEYTQFTKDEWENMGPKTLYFTKKGDRWSFRDKQP